MPGEDGKDSGGQVVDPAVSEYSYPPLNQKKNTIAKDWDRALLQDCSMSRLRIIAQGMSGVQTRHNKEQTFEGMQLSHQASFPNVR